MFLFKHVNGVLGSNMGAARGALQLEVHDQSLQSAETCGTSNIFFGQSGQSGQFQFTCVLGRSMFLRKERMRL